MGVQALPTGVYGPLPPGTMGLILGRSSTLLKGIQIHPGIVDADYQEEIKVMTSVQQEVVVIPQGERIAQLVLIPNKVTNNKRARGNQEFGSPGMQEKAGRLDCSTCPGQLLPLRAHTCHSSLRFDCGGMS